MAFIQQFLNDKVVAKAADTMVNETLRYLYERSAVLAECVPIKETQSFDWKGLLFKEEAPVATLVADDQEIPIRSFGKFEEVIASGFNIADSYMYDETTMKEMYKAMTDAKLQGTSVMSYRDEKGNTTKPGTNDDIAQLIFGSIASLTRGIVDKLDVLTWEALQTGAVSTTSINTNIDIKSINYKDPNADYNHFPNALVDTGNSVSKLNRWSDYENADGIANLYDAIDTYQDTNGFMPKYICMSRKLFNHLKSQKSTQRAAANTLSSGIVSAERLIEVLKNNMIDAEIKIIEDRYQVRDVKGRTQRVRFLNEDTIVFMYPGMGQRWVAPTIDSVTNLVEEGNTVVRPKPGLFIKTYERQVQPKRDVTYGKMTAAPVFLEPRLFYSWKVN
jgi:hypothetical protein